jgi:ABC-type antimicrobial peptide transport system ATPase subunit
VSEQEDDFEVMADPTTAPTSTLPTGCTLDDFCSYAPSRCCIYLPSKTMSAERQCR